MKQLLAKPPAINRKMMKATREADVRRHALEDEKDPAEETKARSRHL